MKRLHPATPLAGLLILLLFVFGISGYDFSGKSDPATRTITDQLGRQVKVPQHPKKIVALHHFGGKIVYALGQQHLLVEKSIYGLEALARDKVDPIFAALPSLIQNHGYNVEGLVSLNPEIIFAYASMDRSEMAQFKNAGIPVVAIKGESFEESFAAIRLMAEILGCEKKGEAYIAACEQLLAMVAKRLQGNVSPPIKVMFAGPKSIYSVATGNMLQTSILELSGAVNVAKELSGFWVNVSPEQISLWNPDVIFLGSYLNPGGREKIYANPQFATIKAIQTRAIHPFPSNVGWWDYPAPHCVLGVVWSAKTLYPELFSDIDMAKLANKFYTKFSGFSFEELGGQLNP